MNYRFRVGVLGATGAVGQQFVRLLATHPWFTITAVAASERSAGKTYSEATQWTGSDQIPSQTANLVVQPVKPDLDCDFVFSGLDASVAGTVETDFASAGYPVISNARNHRMDPTVPLLIPEVNPAHIRLIQNQTYPDGGFIVTNPNCSTVGLVVALAPLYENFGLKAVQVTTLQALSGAGYPGVSAMDILGNVVPYIGGEEDKMETEPLKILGSFSGNEVTPASFAISAQCNRVPVLDGHTECVSVKLDKPASVDDLLHAFRSVRNPMSGLGLPSEPSRLIRLFENGTHPEPRRHVMEGNGMTVSVGRVRSCPVLDFRFVALSHNTIRGAAGGAILNAEWLVHNGLIKH